MEKIYRCECGREFTKPNSFNGHKSHCVTHLTITGNLQKRLDVDKENRKKHFIWKRNHDKTRLEQKQKDLEQWISEKHTCEKCGKVMTEKYASGRFCSKTCAKSRTYLDSTRDKISKALAGRTIIDRYKTVYLKNPNYCVICGNELPYTRRHSKTCSDGCHSKLLSITSKNAVNKSGGNLNPNPNKNCKTGNYNGFHYDSSWELAFLVYNLEHGVNIKRNKQSFEYVYNNEEHSYYPDFIINGEYYEIKNYETDIVRAKTKQFPKELTLHVLYKKDIQHCLDYCIMKYGKKFWELLY